MNWTVFFLTLILVPGACGIIVGLAMLATYAPGWLTGLVALFVLATMLGLVAGEAGRYNGGLW